jgi:capsular polysaccharide biosynthesis protein
MGPGELYRVLWRRKLLVCVTVVAVLGAAVYYTRQEPKTYAAHSLVRVQQKITNVGDAFGALQTGGRLAQTYATIAGTSTIAEDVAELLAGRVPADTIPGSISGSQIADLDLLSITATASTPQRAQLIANAAPTALRQFITRTGTLRDEVVTVEPAALPRAPSSPSLKLNVMAAFVLGLVLAGGLSLLVELVGDRPHGPEELETLTRTPVLGSIAKLELVRIGELPAPIFDAPGERVADEARF